MTEDMQTATDSPSGGVSGEQEMEESENESSVAESSLTLEEQELFDRMMELGVFYGRSKSRTNPLMKKHVLMTRSGFEVLDLHSTISHLKAAAKILSETIQKGGLVLLVGTSPAAKGAVRALGKKLMVPYVSERWLGGTLTNFKTISKRVSYFKKLKEDRDKGKLEKYTKKEQLKFDRELAKLEKLFSGIENLDRLPDMLFIADLAENEFAAKEAKANGIPVVAITNTDADPELADYIIPANDRSPQVVGLVIECLEEEMEKAKKGMVSAGAENVAGDSPADKEERETNGMKSREGGSGQS